MTQTKETFFTIPDIDSIEFKKTKQQIIQYAKNLEKFTDNLQEKVDSLLKAQMVQFVRAYKLHMLKVKEEFKKIEEEIRNKQIIIRNFQNEGQMAILLQKIRFLQNQQSKYQKIMDVQKKRIKELQIQRKIKQNEGQRFSQRMKELIRNNASMDQKILNLSRDRTNQSIPTFSTQISPQHSRNRISKILTHQKNHQLRSLHQKSQYSISGQKEESSKLLKQVNYLKRKNKELTSMSTRFIDTTSEMQQFFVRTVNEIKKVILTRKGIQECTVQDFRMEDKLQLLIKILSNEKLIIHLHEAIFGEKKKPFFIEYSRNNNSAQQKIKLLRLTRNKLPNIKSSRYN